MPSLLRAGALALVLCAACDVGSPRGPSIGSPGLEPPHATDDAGSPMAEPDGETGGGDVGAMVPPAAGTTGGGSPPGSAGSGSLDGAGGSAGAVGPGAVLVDAGVSPDAGGVIFSELHGAELTKDCQETVLCRLQRDEPLEDDTMAACLEASAALLDTDESVQAAFLANVERCQHLVACDYYDCTLSPP